MKSRYDHYDRSVTPHALKNKLYVVWLICITLLLFYTVFVLLSDNSRLNKDVRYLTSKPVFGKTFVKEMNTGLVVVYDSTDALNCAFFDTSNIIKN